LIDSYNLDYSKLKPLDVSRETFPDLEEFRSLIIQKNKEINLISTNTEKISKERHIIDSAQIVEFIDKNDKICTDLGSGSGLPGIVLAIIMKHKKSDMMFHLYEKSFHKSNFLIEVSKRLNLKTKIFQKDIFKEKNLLSDTIVSRAFKPLPIILHLAKNNFKKFKNVVLFLGKNGKDLIEQALKEWEFEYIKKNSLTNPDSFLIKIKNIKKINE